MPSSCWAYNCYERAKPGGSVSFHSFPTKNKMLFRAWCIALRRKNILPTRASRVCSKHFTKDSFQKDCIYRTLKIDAVPTIFDFGKTGDKRLKVNKSLKRSESNKRKKTDAKSESLHDQFEKSEFTQRYEKTEGDVTVGKLVKIDSLPSDQSSNMENENEILRHTIHHLSKKVERFKCLTNVLRSNELISEEAAEVLRCTIDM